MSKTPLRPWRTSSYRARQGLTGLFVTAITIALSGCTSENPIPVAKTEVVNAYGMTLDETASPEQVVYVLLRSLADDVHAAQQFHRAEQIEALHRTFTLAAHSEIERRLLAVLRTVKKDITLGDERDKKLYDIVDKWAPIVAHYVDSFDTDASAASAKMKRSDSADGKRVHVYYPVAHLAKAPEPEQVLDIELVQEPAGDVAYWRVARIDYVTKTRIQPILKPSTAPAAPA